MPETIKHDKGNAVREKIQLHLAEMKATGKTYLICGLCGKRGPLVAQENLKTGQIVILLDNLPQEGRWQLRIKDVPGVTGFIFTSMRICPECVRKTC